MKCDLACGQYLCTQEGSDAFLEENQTRCSAQTNNQPHCRFHFFSPPLLKMNRATIAAILGCQDVVLICTAANEMSWWAGSLPDVKMHELCRKQLFQYLSPYAMLHDA